MPIKRHLTPTLGCTRQAQDKGKRGWTDKTNEQTSELEDPQPTFCVATVDGGKILDANLQLAAKVVLTGVNSCKLADAVL
jgi:hypothetical protein